MIIRIVPDASGAPPEELVILELQGQVVPAVKGPGAGGLGSGPAVGDAGGRLDGMPIGMLTVKPVRVC
jgi:hypothetical protein